MKKYGFKTLAAAIKARSAPPLQPPAVAMPGQSGDLFADHSASTVAEEAQHRTVVYDTILNWADFDQWLERLHKAHAHGHRHRDHLARRECARKSSASVSACSRRSRHHPAAPRGPDAPAQLPLDEVLAASNPGWKTQAPKLGQHIKYDRHVFANHGIEVQGYAHDTMLQSYVLEVHKPTT